MFARNTLVLAATLSLACGVVIAPAQAAPAAATANAPVIAEGTPVRLVTGRMVSSEADQPGEVVEFVVKQDLVVGGQVLLAENSYVYGRITFSEMNDRAAGRPGSLEFRLESLHLANGQEIPLRTIRAIPGNTADATPDKLTNLVNSPYAPFAHFNNGTDVTVPKNSPLTLYVGADVTLGAPSAAKVVRSSNAGSLAARIVNADSGAESLGDIAREQRERGKIAGGMVGSAH